MRVTRLLFRFGDKNEAAGAADASVVDGSKSRPA